MKGDLLATAGTLDGIHQSVTRFYCGTLTALVPNGERQWAIVRKSDGKVFDDVVIKQRKGRYRFEMVEPVTLAVKTGQDLPLFA